MEPRMNGQEGCEEGGWGWDISQRRFRRLIPVDLYFEIVACHLYNLRGLFKEKEQKIVDVNLHT